MLEENLELFNQIGSLILTRRSSKFNLIGSSNDIGSDGAFSFSTRSDELIDVIANRNDQFKLREDNTRIL